MSKVEDKKVSKLLNHQGEPAVEFDEVMNDVEGTFKEMDITLETHSGKVYIAAKDGNVILQGIVAGYIKPEHRATMAGSHMDFVGAEGKSPDLPSEHQKPALFSGTIYFEDLGVTVLETKGTEVDKSVEKEKEDEPKQDKKEEQKETKAPDIEKDTDDDVRKKTEKVDENVGVPPIPTEEELKAIPAGQLQPKKGFSRQGRKIFWDRLRELYPEAFDQGGNWLGMSAPEKPPKEKSKVKPNAKELKVDQSPPGSMKEIGKENRMTNMTDPTILNGIFIGKHFKGKGYSVVSTPGEDEDSAFIICNKPRTAKFVMAGMARNNGFAKLLVGCDQYPITEFKDKWFENAGQRVYFVVNAVTALAALGTQKKDIEDIVEAIK